MAQFSDLKASYAYSQQEPKQSLARVIFETFERLLLALGAASLIWLVICLLFFVPDTNQPQQPQAGDEFVLLDAPDIDNASDTDGSDGEDYGPVIQPTTFE